MHYWIGSFCYTSGSYGAQNEKTIASLSDVIMIQSDLENRIPDKSWMLYLLELFNKQGTPVELNLICQFDGQNYFEAIFAGYNQYRFRRVIPAVGHSYHRLIILDYHIRAIKYKLQDFSDEMTEEYIHNIPEELHFVFEGSKIFTGIEWWNKSGNYPFPIKFKVQISDLKYGKRKSIIEPSNIVQYSLNSLASNTEGKCKDYPVSFSGLAIVDKSVCYTVSSGSCCTGPNYSQ